MKMKLARRLKNLTVKAKELLYPAVCIICGASLQPFDSPHICPSCWARIKPNRPPYCRKCGRSLFGMAEDVDICSECRQKNFKFNRAISPWIYEGVIKECIHKLKYEAKTLLCKVFVEKLSDFAKDHLDVTQIDIVVPVPLGRAKFIERQFNQSQLLAKNLARKLSIKASYNNLVRRFSGKPQSSLSRRKRLDNVKNAFYLKNSKEVRNKSVLLIDDVFTTGATANECAKALSKAGAKRVIVLTLARGL